MRVSFGKVLVFFLKVFTLPVLLFLLWDGFDFTRDYENYYSNYIYEWRQFELGFELVLDGFRYFLVDFNFVWLFFLVTQLLLVAFLYNSTLPYIIFLLNFILVLDGMLATQVRFALASLLFLVLFQLFNNCRYRVSRYIPLLSSVFHFSMILPGVAAWLGNFLRPRLVSNPSSIYLWAILLLLFFSSVSLFSQLIMQSLGYWYYVSDSSFMQPKSTASIAYITVMLGFVILFLRFHYQNVEPYMYFALVVLIICLSFFQYAVVSGRLLKFYFLIEPFVVSSILERFSKTPCGLLACFFLIMVFGSKMISLL